MGKLRMTSAGLVAVAVVAVGAAAATAATHVKVIAFTATYSGQATTQQSDTTVAITANGTGDSSQQPCVPFTGPGKMTGVAGTTLSFKVATGAKGCGDEAGQVFSVVGYATVTNATGKLKKAKGTLKFTGSYDRSSGDFSVKFTGKLKQ